jgi:hypothetical protein
MAAQSKQVFPRDHLDRRIASLDAEVEEIQAEYGDPAEALGRYLVERFGLTALMETYQEYLNHDSSFLDDDWNNGGEFGDGGRLA